MSSGKRILFYLRFLAVLFIVTIIIFAFILHSRHASIFHHRIPLATKDLGDVAVTRKDTKSLTISDNSKGEVSSRRNLSVDLHLFHPSSIDKMWTKLDNVTVIRRLAYFDIREKSVAVIFNSMHDDRVKKLPLCAKLIYEDMKPVCTELRYWTRSCRLDYHYKEWYVNYMLRTMAKINPTKPPLYAKIGLGKNCSGPMYDIPIQYDEQKRNLTYGVCLHKGLFNMNEPQLLVDWVELQIALGAEIITVYLQNISESYYTVMKPYIDRGIVEVLDWSFKPPLIPGYTKDWGQTGVVNECIYRNLYRVKYLALLDVDEFIMPLENKTVMEMVYNIEKDYKGRYASYLFRTIHMYDDGVMLPEVESAKKCNDKTWPRYYRFTLQRQNVTDTYKMIVRMDGINAGWLHWPASHKRGFKKYLMVPYEYGSYYHYRVPEIFKEKEAYRSFRISQYFNQTIKHLQCNDPNHESKKGRNIDLFNYLMQL